MEAEVLYCDNHLLVLNKPAGLLSQPNDSDADSLESIGKHYLKKKFQKPGNVFLEAVHRLDKQASGIVLFARTSKALSRLNQTQREGHFQKKYLALAEGRLSNGELIDYLRHDSYRAVVDPNGKRCHLKYRALKNESDYTFLKIYLLTGRYHQIRAQFAIKGHPLLGDRKYGSKFSHDIIFLHHSYLEFFHPVSKKNLVFRAALPHFWSAFIAASPIS